VQERLDVELGLLAGVPGWAVGRAEGAVGIDPCLECIEVFGQLIDAPLAQVETYALGEGFVGGDGLNAEVGGLFVAFEVEAIAESGDFETGETFVDLEELAVGFLARGPLGLELVDGAEDIGLLDAVVCVAENPDVRALGAGFTGDTALLVAAAFIYVLDA
jgi:hypothetical protein